MMTFDRKTLFENANAKRLDDVDLPRIGKTIGVGEDELHAFMDVEAAGSGFDSKGRVKMLFEPHIFYKMLSGKKREQAVAQGLAYPKWKKGGYPSDSYPRLKRAMAIDETAALKSASWGLPQIMGFNCVGAGYATPQDMIADFMMDEDNHLEAMVRLIKHFKIDDDLKAHRWDVLETVWNGGGFKGAYAVKMKAAFAKWQKIKDTPLPTFDDAPAKRPADTDVSPQMQKPSVEGVTAGGAAVVVTAAASGVNWWVVAALAFIAVILAVGLYLSLKSKGSNDGQ